MYFDVVNVVIQNNSSSARLVYLAKSILAYDLTNTHKLFGVPKPRPIFFLLLHSTLSSRIYLVGVFVNFKMLSYLILRIKNHLLRWFVVLCVDQWVVKPRVCRP